MTLLAKFWLGERVSPMRWLGVAFITAGVGFVTRGPSYTDHSTVATHEVREENPEPAELEPAEEVRQ
jgi:drug/metabolite transporter (DMT)-like permease